ncbi:hypothetical protein MMC06_005962 [Schaereria dolodes]|nr:hypothetical protein [Schaereria dolodes]
MSATSSSKPIPPGAWDTHIHIFEPELFPLPPKRHFTPSCASYTSFTRFLSSLPVSHACITHGLSYGADCTPLVAHLARSRSHSQSGHQLHRGICVLDLHNLTDELLTTYHAAGVRSVRLNLNNDGAMHDIEAQISLLKATAARLVRWDSHNIKGWSVQIQQPHVEFWTQLAPICAALPVPVVVDHMALVQMPSMLATTTQCQHQIPTPAAVESSSSPSTLSFSANFSTAATAEVTDPLSSPGVLSLLSALRAGNVYIKLSAPYRCSALAPAYPDLQSLVAAFVTANPLRILYASDWPHTRLHKDREGLDPLEKEAFQEVDDGAWVESLSAWMDEEEWGAMWKGNPERLYV